MNSKLHNAIFVIVLAASIVLIIMMKKGSLMLGYFAIIPYILVFVSLWMLLSINMIKNAMKNLYEVPTDKRAETFSALLKKTFGVGIFLDKQELKDFYHYVVNLKQVSYNTKVKLYDVFESKYIYVPYPTNKVNFRKVKR